MNAQKIRSLSLCALFSALMAVCAWLALPMGDIAFTMQTFALFLTLGLLGGKRGSVTCAVYLLLGAVGLPVFHGFQGGVGILLGATGGYLMGFLAAALIYWAATALFGQALPAKAAAMVLGCLGCYAFGTAWFFFAYTGGSGLSLGAVLLKCVVPYLIPDACKIALALVLTTKLARFC